MFLEGFVIYYIVVFSVVAYTVLFILGPGSYIIVVTRFREVLPSIILGKLSKIPLSVRYLSPPLTPAPITMGHYHCHHICYFLYGLNEVQYSLI